MLKQNYGTTFNTQIEYLSNNIAKTFNCSRISIATHATIILDAYKEEKRFRPKLILKRAYKESNKKLFQNAPSHKTRIRDQLFVIDEKSLKEAYILSLKMPLSTIYKSFNFQILNRTLFTASKAYKCNIRENDKCIKCNEIEDTAHLLIDCDNYAYNIWTELNICLKILSPQIKESISWRNIIFHKKIKGLDYEEMYQFRVLMQITKYAIYTKRNENFNFSEVRIRAHMLSYCNSTMIVLKRIGKKGQFILKLKKIIENRLITNAAIQK